jgi:hypothetical protein
LIALEILMPCVKIKVLIKKKVNERGKKQNRGNKTMEKSLSSPAVPNLKISDKYKIIYTIKYNSLGYNLKEKALLVLLL